MTLEIAFVQGNGSVGCHSTAVTTGGWGGSPCQACIPSHSPRLTPNSPAAGDPQDKKSHPCTLRISFWAGRQCGQVLQLGRTIDCFSPLAAYTAPPNTVRTSPQGGDCGVISISNPLNLVSKFHLCTNKTIHRPSPWDGSVTGKRFSIQMKPHG